MQVANRHLTNPPSGTPRLAYTGRGKYTPPGRAVQGRPRRRPGRRARRCLRAPAACRRALPDPPPRRCSPGAAWSWWVASWAAPCEMELPESVDVTSPAAIPPVLSLRVVGTVRPGAGAVAVLGRPAVLLPATTRVATPLGASGEDPPIADPVFVGPGAARLGAHHEYTVDMPVLPERVRLDDAPPCAGRSTGCSDRPTRLLAHHRLPAAGGPRPRRRRAGPGADRCAAGRHPARAAELVDPLPRGRARRPRSARPSSALAKLRGLTGRQTRRFGLAEVFLLLLVAAPLGTLIGLPRGAWLGEAGVRAGHRGGLHLAGAADRAARRRGRASSPPRCPRGRSSGGRCPSCCAGCRRGAPGAAPAWSTASSWCSQPPGSCSWSATAAAGPAPSRCSARAWSRWPAACSAARILVRVARRRSTVVARPRPGRRHGRLGRRRPPPGHRAHRLGARGGHLPAPRRRAGLDGGRAQPGRAVRGRDRRRGGAAGAGTGLAGAARRRARRPTRTAATRWPRSPSRAAPGGPAAGGRLDPRRPGARLGLARGRAHVGPLRPAPGADRPGAAAARPARGHRRPAAGQLPVTAAAHGAARPRGRLGPGRPRRAAARQPPLHRPAAGRLHPGRRLPPGRPRRRPSQRRLRPGDRHPARPVGGAAPADGGPTVPLVDSFRIPDAWRPVRPPSGGPTVALRPGQDAAGRRCMPPAGRSPRSCTVTRPSRCRRSPGAARRPAPGTPAARSARPPAWPGGRPVPHQPRGRYLPRSGDDAVLVDLELALRLSEDDSSRRRPEVWLSRDDPAAEQALRAVG